ncbi:MAG TPA: hypothetical protein VNN80_36185, partial [Polyangiaceae bacterium]|nr:hypothetical protein [Polyangiaceae bacterium]
MLPIWLRPRVIVAILLMAGAAVAQPPESATRTQARTLGYAGVAAYQAGDYATAHEKLENA